MLTRVSDFCPAWIGTGARRGSAPAATLAHATTPSCNAFFRSDPANTKMPLLAANADRIFRTAQGIAGQRGALFRLIFLVYPDECRRQAFDFDLSLLETRFLTLMPYCLGG